MWHDELYTFYISQQPGVGAMWHAIRSFDLNPPLSYLLTRLSFHIFGINTLATRLPEIISFLVFLLSIFFFARRRLGTLFGLFVTAALLQTDTFSFSVEARPYALMLAGTGVALLSWQTAVDAHRTGRRPRAWLRKLAVAGVFAAVITLVLGHLFGIAVLFVLALAELFRARQRGALDWPLTLALVSPLLLLATCIPMLRSHAHAMYPAAFLPDLDTINDFYGRSFAFQLAGVCIAAIAVHLPVGRRYLLVRSFDRSRDWIFSTPEWIVILGLLAVPMVLIVCLMAMNAAFYPRYGIVASIGAALLIAAVIGRWTRTPSGLDGRVALLTTLILLLTAGVLDAIPHEIAEGDLIPAVANSEPHARPCDSCARTAALDPTLPLVDASGLAFMEMNHNEPASTLARVYYLTDPVASSQIAHANIFERMPQVVQRFGLRGHSEPYDRFIGAHPRFFVLGRINYPEDWLLRKLIDDGAEIRLLTQVHDSYRDTELYEVSIHPIGELNPNGNDAPAGTNLAN